MRINTAILLLASLLVVACQQGQANNDAAAQQLAPEPLVEPIDPVTNPVAAVNARKQHMATLPDLNAMRGEIMTLIGDAKADTVAQCRVVGFGSKPCGGPAGYIALSVKDGNEAHLMALINRYNAANKAENDRLGLMSNCAVEPEPTVILKDGMCTLHYGANSTEY